MQKRQWKRATRGHRCAVCGKDSFCTYSDNLILCMRVKSDRPSACRLGGWLHSLGPDTQPLHVSLPKPEKPYVDWNAVAKEMFCHEKAPATREALAKQLRVSPQSLYALRVGWGYDEYRKVEFSSWPERNPFGTVSGIIRRYQDGAKRTIEHSTHGLYFSRPIRRRPFDPILLVEGGSDTAALLDCGVNVIGRPSNLGGLDQIISVAQYMPAWTPWIVIGERDPKSDADCPKPCDGCGKCFPGLFGARETAKRLSDAIKRPVKWILPPAKDMREWLQGRAIPAPQLLKEISRW